MTERAEQQERVLAASRRAEIADLLVSNGSVTTAELRQRFGISPMTARRDLSDLERQGRARRTHGGAVLPRIAAHEDSFAARAASGADAELTLASRAAALLSPGQSVFLDSSTTAFHLARRIVQDGVAATIITNSEPVMELVATSDAPNVELVAVGGLLRRLTRSFVGPLAIAAIASHYADRLFLSCTGISSGSVLTDADPLEAAVKRAMIAQAEEPILLLDGSTLGTTALSAIGPLADMAGVIAHSVPPAELASLRTAGVTVTSTAASAPGPAGAPGPS